MLHQICKSLLQPSVARVSYPVGRALGPVPNCFVRYRKKVYSPLAPTKLFRVKQRVIQDPEERAKLCILHARYKTAMKALRLHFREEIAAKEAKLSDQSHLDADLQHHTWSIEENEKFNQESAALREQREVRELREKEEKELQLLMEMEEQKRKQQEYAAEQVRKVKEDAVDFISVDQLDSAIEAALNTRCVHNFAIDVHGNRYIEQTDGSTVISPKSEQHELSDDSDT